MTEDQFCCCVWRPADIGWRMVAAWLILVKGVSPALAASYAPRRVQEQASVFTLIRKPVADILTRHNDRLAAYAGRCSLTSMTTRQWLCCALRPSRWDANAFAIRDYFLTGAPLLRTERCSKTFRLARARHAGNVRAYSPESLKT